MTPSQNRRFNKLCKDMAALLNEVRAENGDLTLFLEDGVVSMYDWPTCEANRPEQPVSDSHYWAGASGGGAGNGS